MSPCDADETLYLNGQHILVVAPGVVLTMWIILKTSNGKQMIYDHL